VVRITECDHESSTIRRPWPTGELLRHGKKTPGGTQRNYWTFKELVEEGNKVDWKEERNRSKDKHKYFVCPCYV